MARFDKHATDISAMVLRAGLGVMLLPHGLQKTLGWFGGYGFSGTMQFFTETMGIPSVLAFAAIVTESIGALCLLAGLGTRVWSAAIAVLMVVAAAMVHIEHGFFMNWFGSQEGEGFEFHILAVCMAVSICLTGGGRFAIDTFVSSPGAVKSPES